MQALEAVSGSKAYTASTPALLACLSYSFSAGMLGASLELVQGSSKPCQQVQCVLHGVSV